MYPYVLFPWVQKSPLHYMMINGGHLSTFPVPLFNDKKGYELWQFLEPFYRPVPKEDISYLQKCHKNYSKVKHSPHARYVYLLRRYRSNILIVQIVQSCINLFSKMNKYKKCLHHFPCLHRQLDRSQYNNFLPKDFCSY